MTTPSDQELERLFEQHGIARRHLYPWWYLLYRAFGLDLEPPILFSLTRHLVVEGVSIGVIMIGGSALSTWLFGSRPFVLAPLWCLIVVIPLLNWRMYRRMRARIGLGAAR
ncbi:MAG: hypothetical protein RIC56_00870 [Pseudomonadales bacterium]